MQTFDQPLMNDGFDGEPAKRVLQYVKARKAAGSPVAGIYCGYAPMELFHAMDVTPAVLCAFSAVPIPAAETVLPANLCPLIKSSYGFIIEGTCPFFGLAQVVIAETTCDGKKKMFELIADIKPLFVMDLPQLPDRGGAQHQWRGMIRSLAGFLGANLGVAYDEERLESTIVASNRRNRLMQEIFDFAARVPSVLSWQEIYDIGFFAQAATPQDAIERLAPLPEKLQRRVDTGQCAAPASAPRVLVSGCPIGGDATKIYRLVEEAGGVVVLPDNCTGIKSFVGQIEENTGDPCGAIARRYLEIPCACMTPNERRLTALSQMIADFKPDAVIDFVLQSCHGYNVESAKVGVHVKETCGLPFLKIESDYSQSDLGQLRTRIEAMLETRRPAAVA